MREKCLKISGRVQGVGFRFWMVRIARAVGNVSGYVCNLPEGDVLVLMCGEEDKLNELQQFLYKGPLFARVDSVIEVPEYKYYFPPVESGIFKRI